MRTKKLFVILIAIAFLMSVLLCFALLFSVKKVDARFSVSENKNVEEVVNCLEEFNGVNLLFFDVEEINQAMQQFPYFEVVSLKKSYPNVITVEIQERREVYDLLLNETVVNVASDGFVLNIQDKSEWSGPVREKIVLETEGLTFFQPEVGKYLSCGDDKLLYSVFDMALEVELTDCIKTLKIEVEPYLRKDAIFKTYTGASIVVFEADERGVDKITEAFSAYYEIANDYQKTFGELEVFILTETGMPSVIWRNGADEN